MAEDWTAAWQDAVDAVGHDFADGEVVWGADPVERSTIRRFVEPLELDCALHLDPAAAREHGHADVTMPYTGVMAFTIPAMWEPGRKLFDDADRDAEPVDSPISGTRIPVGPPTEGFFATDVELDFERPVTAGEHLGRRGRRLVACTPKETAVGRGAFLTFETDIVTRDLEVVARMRSGVFAYNPHPGQEDSA